MKNALIIINKVSGMSSKAELEAALVRNLKSQHYNPLIKYTTDNQPEDIVKNNAENTDLIVVAGGDGTISKLIHMMYQENIHVPVVVIPSGTVNDFARANDIPLNPLLTAKQLDTSQTQPVDIIKINDINAGYMVAFGEFMTSFANVSSAAKKRTGRLAYLFAGLKTLLNLKQYRVSIKINGLDMETESILTIVSKISSVGSLEKLIPEAKPNDGLLHILNIEPVNTKDIVQLIYMAFRGRISEHPKVMYLTAEQVEIKSKQLKEMNIDGDIHKYNDASISVVKDGLTLVKNS